MKRSRSPAERCNEDPSAVGEVLFNSLCEALQNAKQAIEDGKLPVGNLSKPGQGGVPTTVDSNAFAMLNTMFSTFMTAATSDMRREEEAAKKASLVENGATESLDVASITAAATDKFQPNIMSVIDLNQQLNIAQRQLRKWAGFGVVGQKVIPPKQSDTFESDVPTFEIDAFLYGEDEDIDDLCDEGKVSRHYCTACKSTDVAPTQFITHSFSKDQLFYIFCFLVPYLRVADKTKPNGITSVVDVGSRLGVVLAAAYFAGAPLTKIVGIEMDQQLCEIQERLVKSHRGMKDRVSIVKGDALSDENLSILAESDLVVLHNVFEWFSEESAQLAIWKKLRTALSKRKGQYLLVCPGIQESLRPLVRAFGGTDDDVTTTGSSSSSTKKKAMSEMEVDACCNKFLKGWVEEVDCAVALGAFIDERRGNSGTHQHDADCADGSCGNPPQDEDEEVEEFVEHAQNIHIYRVL